MLPKDGDVTLFLNRSLYYAGQIQTYENPHSTTPVALSYLIMQLLPSSRKNPVLSTYSPSSLALHLGGGTPAHPAPSVIIFITFSAHRALSNTTETSGQLVSCHFTPQTSEKHTAQSQRGRRPCVYIFGDSLTWKAQLVKNRPQINVAADWSHGTHFKSRVQGWCDIKSQSKARMISRHRFTHRQYHTWVPLW